MSATPRENPISPTTKRIASRSPGAVPESPVLHGLKFGCKRSAEDCASQPPEMHLSHKTLKRQSSTEELFTPLSRTRGTLVLSDGSRWPGYSFGAEKSTSGEVVFNTSMVGYPEALTDPSYRGQLLTLTFPLIGNYGVPPETRDDLGLPIYFESESVHITALIVSDYSAESCHWNQVQSLSQWLKTNNVPPASPPPPPTRPSPCPCLAGRRAPPFFFLPPRPKLAPPPPHPAPPQ